MMKRHRSNRHRRGSTMILIIALTVILGTLCAIALIRSLECYRVSALAERKLQLRAAAEGAAVLYQKSKSASVLENLEIGRCTVRLDKTSTDSVKVDVSLRGDNQEEVQTQRFLISDSNGRRHVLEVIP